MEKVSVIIPAYNKAELTVRTVESVLHQTYPDVEIIVVDDGSKDATRQRLSPYAGRIKYVHKENGGACSARNAGIRLAQGDYIGFLDCDDLYAPDKVALCVEFLKKHPEIGFVHTDVYFIDAADRVVGRYAHRKAERYQGWIAPKLVLGNFICNSTAIVRREALTKAGFFDESMFIPADWDMWIRLAEIAKTGYINAPLTEYRVTDNYTFNRLELAEREEGAVIDKFFQRNRHLNGRFKHQALSNYHLRFAQCYFLKGNQTALKEKFCLSLQKNRFNIKAYVLFLYYLAARKHLYAVLKKKIVRT